MTGSRISLQPGSEPSKVVDKYVSVPNHRIQRDGAASPSRQDDDARNHSHGAHRALRTSKRGGRSGSTDADRPEQVRHRTK